MEIKVFSTNKLQTNCYLIENNGQCIVVDPCVKYEDLNRNYDKNIVGVFITHAHFDHIEQIKTFLNKGIVFYMHENAYPKLKDPKLNYSKVTGFPMSFDLDNEEVIFVDNNVKLDLIGRKVSFLYLPGHSDCSIAMLIADHMFCGDMLFKGSVGRHDLPTSSYNDMMNSIRILKNFNEDYHVYPGHGPKTSLDFEIKNNPYFR